MLMRGDARCAVPARRPRTSRGSSRGSARRIRGAMRCARGPEAQVASSLTLRWHVTWILVSGPRRQLSVSYVAFMSRFRGLTFIMWDKCCR